MMLYVAVMDDCQGEIAEVHGTLAEIEEQFLALRQDHPDLYMKVFPEEKS